MSNFADHSATIKTNHGKIEDINHRLTHLDQGHAQIKSSMAIEKTQVERFCEVERML
jgi:hypothetical protein